MTKGCGGGDLASEEGGSLYHGSESRFLGRGLQWSRTTDNPRVVPAQAVWVSESRLAGAGEAGESQDVAVGLREGWQGTLVPSQA